MKKLLCLALAIVMCLGLLPTTAFAAEEVINEVVVYDYTEPSYGEHPNYELRVPEGAHYHFITREELNKMEFLLRNDRDYTYNGVVWYKDYKPMTKEETFLDSGYCMYALLVPNKGYKFHDDVTKITLTINGKSTADMLHYQNGGVGWFGFRTKDYSVKVPKFINEIELSDFAPPVLTAFADYDLSVPKGAPYHLATKAEMQNEGYDPIEVGQFYNGIRWHKLRGVMDITETFTDPLDDAYYMDLVVAADPGSWIVDNPTITINGEPAPVWEWSSDGTSIYIKTKYMTAAPPTPISQVEIVGFDKPVYGGHPDYEMTVPEGAPYHFASWEELGNEGFPTMVVEVAHNGMWWFEGEKLLFPNGTCTDQKEDTYHTHMVLIADPGYAFADNVSVSAGGNVEFATIRSSGSALNLESDAFTVTDPDAKYRINLETGGPGKVTASCDAAIRGTEITLTVKPNAGSRMDSIQVLDGDNNPVPMTQDQNTCTFTMPLSDVTVKTAFKQAVPASTAYEVRFNANGMEGAVPATLSYKGSDSSKTYTIPEGSNPTKENFDFIGWNTQADGTGTGYQPGDTITLTKDNSIVTLYAQCAAHTHKAVLVKGQAAAGKADGWKDYYKCECGKFFEDETRTKEIIDLAAWKTGDGKLVKREFKDVEPDQWYSVPVDWAVENGITQGFPDGTFQPNTICTRGHIVTFLWRAAGCPAPKSTSTSFTDLESDAFYYSAVLWAVENEITTGITATEFGPKAACTRGQVATFLWRAAGKPTPTKDNVFTDLESNEFYYTPVLWAAENGIAKGMTDTTFEPERICTRGQIVTFIYRAEH